MLRLSFSIENEDVFVRDDDRGKYVKIGLKTFKSFEHSIRTQWERWQKTGKKRIEEELLKDIGREVYDFFKPFDMFSYDEIRLELPFGLLSFPFELMYLNDFLYKDRFILRIPPFSSKKTMRRSRNILFVYTEHKDEWFVLKRYVRSSWVLPGPVNITQPVLKFMNIDMLHIAGHIESAYVDKIKTFIANNNVRLRWAVLNGCSGIVYTDFIKLLYNKGLSEFISPLFDIEESVAMEWAEVFYRSFTGNIYEVFKEARKNMSFIDAPYVIVGLEHKRRINPFLKFTGLVGGIIGFIGIAGYLLLKPVKPQEILNRDVSYNTKTLYIVNHGDNFGREIYEDLLDRDVKVFVVSDTVDFYKDIDNGYVLFYSMNGSVLSLEIYDGIHKKTVYSEAFYFSKKEEVKQKVRELLTRVKILID